MTNIYVFLVSHYTFLKHLMSSDDLVQDYRHTKPSGVVTASQVQLPERNYRYMLTNFQFEGCSYPDGQSKKPCHHVIVSSRYCSYYLLLRYDLLLAFNVTQLLLLSISQLETIIQGMICSLPKLHGYVVITLQDLLPFQHSNVLIDDP